MNRFQFVADRQRRHGVKRLCQILGIARSSFCHWPKTAAARAAREGADARLAARIPVIHKESSGTYGAPRVMAELNDAGMRVHRKRVARVTRKFGISGLKLRCRHKTTIADQAGVKGRSVTARKWPQTPICHPASVV